MTCMHEDFITWYLEADDSELDAHINTSVIEQPCTVWYDDYVSVHRQNKQPVANVQLRDSIDSNDSATFHL